MEQENGSNIWIKIGIGVGIFVLTLALFALSIEFTATKVTMWIVIGIASLIFVYMTRKIWQNMTFQKFKFMFAAVCLFVLGGYLLFMFTKSLEFAYSDQTPISASISLILFVCLGFVLTKGFSIPETNNHLMRSLFLLILSGAYVLFGGMLEKIENRVWFETVGVGAFAMWFWIIALKRVVMYKISQGKITARLTEKAKLKFFLKQTLWILVAVVVPFLPITILETINWWQVLSLGFSYLSLLYLGWILWFGKYLSRLANK